MNYTGRLYGKVNGVLFDTGKTSQDWDEMEKKLQEAEHLEHDLKWISITAALPDTERLVFLSISDSNNIMLSIGYYSIECKEKNNYHVGWFLSNGEPVDNKLEVTHWMQIKLPNKP